MTSVLISAPFSRYRYAHHRHRLVAQGHIQMGASQSNP